MSARGRRQAFGRERAGGPGSVGHDALRLNTRMSARTRALVLVSVIVAITLASTSDAGATNTAGTFDPSFYQGATAGSGDGWAVALQPDGKIVVAGSSQHAFTAGEPSDFAVARFD